MSREGLGCHLWLSGIDMYEGGFESRALLPASCGLSGCSLFRPERGKVMNLVMTITHLSVVFEAAMSQRGYRFTTSRTKGRWKGRGGDPKEELQSGY